MDDLGLEPSPPPELLPEIDHDDVHLLAWLAVSPVPMTIAEQLGEFPLGDKLWPWLAARCPLQSPRPVTTRGGGPSRCDAMFAGAQG